MRDWGELVGAVTQTFHVEARAADGKLRVAIADQVIRLEPGIAFDEPWLSALADIAPESRLAHARDALELNARFAVGALAIIDSSLCLRWAWPVLALTPATLDRYLRFVAREAARLRRVLAGLELPHSALDFMVD